MAIESVNPATGERLRRFDAMSDAEVGDAVAACAGAQRAWAAEPFEERAVPLRAAARLLRAEREALAREMALEMGKPLAQGVAEAEKCALACEYYAERAAGLLAPEPVARSA